ncbi:MAG: hypothetical protein Q9187_005694 [Circinaria calcarea]
MTEPAPPILGSALLSSTIQNQSRAPTPAPLSIGHAQIDIALRGGFRYGEITSIAGASGMGKTLVFPFRQPIRRHLLEHDGSEVALIDTTGSFSPLRLRDVVSLRLSQRSEGESDRHSEHVYEKLSVHSGIDLMDKANQMALKMLDRVKVMRVFDFAGVVEAIGEVGEMWEKVDMDVDRTKAAFRPGDEIPNSQDSDDSEEYDGSEDMSNRLPTATAPGIGMIVLDNIANPISSIMAKSQLQAQALLIPFLRSLYHLTAQHHLGTLLLNSAVNLTPSTNANYQRYSQPEDNASIFASTLGKPALGKIYANLIDTSIFMSSIPKTKEDAEVAYGGGARDGGRWKSVFVLEVLRDRYEDREGRWAAFEVINGIGIK